MGKDITNYKNQQKNKQKNLYYPAHPDKEMDGRLFHLLANATPHGHEHVLRPFMPKGYQEDKKGNMIYRIGKTKDHRTMFSCHMDTVHSKPIVLIPHLNETGYCAAWTQGDKKLEQCILGADDKVGMYIMLRMMEAKVPGMYVFHVGEECGCLGSKHIVSNSPSIVNNIDRCIAFDRKDYTNVITRQRGGECASREFALALSEQLNTHLGTEYSKYAPDPTGVYTDSAEYTHLISECTNLSVGYFHAHTATEHFDHYWLESLLIPALIKVEWANLPKSREPKPKYVASNNYYQGGRGYGNGSYGNYGYGGRYEGHNDWWDDDDIPPTNGYRRVQGTNIWEKDVKADKKADQHDLPFTPKNKTQEAWLEKCNGVKFETRFTDLPIYDIHTHGLIEGVNKESMIALIYHEINTKPVRLIARWMYEAMFRGHWQSILRELRDQDIIHLKQELTEANNKITCLSGELSKANMDRDLWKKHHEELLTQYNNLSRKLEICQEQENGQNAKH